MEYLLVPKRNIFLTQGYGDGSYSHKDCYAFDMSASKSGDYNVYMPFSGYVARLFHDGKNANNVWIVSNDKVMCADGKSRYAVMMLTHCNEIPNLKVGQTFKQNDVLLTDGTSGGVARHLHFELALYDTKESIDANWHQTKQGYWVINNGVQPDKYMVINDNYNIINLNYLDRKYAFVHQNNINIPTEPEKPVEPPKNEFKVGDKVEPIELVNWQGTPLIRYDDVYTIMDIDERGAILGAERNGELQVWAVLKLDNIKKI